MKELIGTEKQVAWAEEIRKGVMDCINEAYKIREAEWVEDGHEAYKEDSLMNVTRKELLNNIESLEKAADFIDTFRHVIPSKDKYDAFYKSESFKIIDNYLSAKVNSNSKFSRALYAAQEYYEEKTLEDTLK